MQYWIISCYPSSTLFALQTLTFKLDGCIEGNAFADKTGKIIIEGKYAEDIYFL